MLSTRSATPRSTVDPQHDRRREQEPTNGSVVALARRAQRHDESSPCGGVLAPRHEMRPPTPQGEIAAPEPAPQLAPPEATGAGRRECWRPPPAALWRSLRLLQRLLASLPRDRRQSAIQDFSACVRGVLLCHMLAESAGGDPPLCGPRPERTPRGGHRRDGDVRQVPGERGAGKPAGGVCTVRIRGTTQYFARITIDGIAICSRSTRCREEALRLRGLLAGVAAARPAPAGGGASGHGWLVAALSGAGERASAGAPPGPAPLLRAPGVRSGPCSRQVAPWSFRVLVDARCWVGQVLSTCKVDSIVEALAIRECVRAARSQGWSSLRRTLARFMPRLRRHPLLPGIAPLGNAARGHKRKAASQVLPGEAWLESLDRRCLVLRLRREEQRGLQRERCARRQRERCEARVQRVEGRVAGVAAQIAQRLEARGCRLPALGGCRRPGTAASRRRLPRPAERPPKRRVGPRLAAPRRGSGAGLAVTSRRLLRFGKKGGTDFGSSALLMVSALGA